MIPPQAECVKLKRPIEKSPTCSASRRPTAAGDYRGTARIPPSCLMLKPCFGFGGVSRTSSVSAQLPTRRKSRNSSGSNLPPPRPTLNSNRGPVKGQYAFYRANYSPSGYRERGMKKSVLAKPIPVPDLACKLYLAKSMTPRLYSSRSEGHRTPITMLPVEGVQFPSHEEVDIETQIRQQVESELASKYEEDHRKWMEKMQQEIKDQWDMVKTRLDDKDKRIAELEAIVTSMESNRQAAPSSSPSPSGSPSVKEYISTQLTHSRQTELENLDAELAGLLDCNDFNECDTDIINENITSG